MGTKRLMAGALSGFLMIGASAPIWANPPAGDMNSATQVPLTTKSADHSPLGILAPILTESAQHSTQKTCKPDTLYSQHDVVGDSEGCFINRFDARGAAGVNGIPGIF